MSKFALSLQRPLLIMLAALLVISAGCQALDRQSSTDPVVGNTGSPATGSRAPGFTLTNLNGDEVSLGDLRGQPVLINFWATW